MSGELCQGVFAKFEARVNEYGYGHKSDNSILDLVSLFLSLMPQCSTHAVSAPCGVLYLAPMLRGCCLGAAVSVLCLCCVCTVSVLCLCCVCAA